MNPQNQNNILRPPILNLHNEHQDQDEGAAANAPAGLNHIQMLALRQDVVRMVSDALRVEGRQIIQAILNPNDDADDVDQPIDPNANLAEMDRVPDIVKSLKEFSGQPGEFSSWKKAVDRILKIYEHLRGTPRYYGMLSVIRNKIVGQADIALESYNTPLNWERIAKCLTLHYADKRDIGTLEYQMTTLVQGNNTIPDFYQIVFHHLSLILNKLCSSDMSQESLNNMTQAYRGKALDTFVRGLNGDLPRLLSIKEPADLPQALHLCLKLENVNFRTRHAMSSNSNVRNTQLPIPAPRRIVSSQSLAQPLSHSQFTPLPAPRKIFQPDHVSNPQRPFKNNLYGQMTYPIQYRENQPRYQQNNPYTQPPKPSPAPQPKSEPMDVDTSIRSKNINYMNKPQPQTQPPIKRPYSQQVHQPQKNQRLFHTEESYEDNTISNEQYETEIASENSHDQALVDYIDTYDNPEYDQTEHVDDIHFLD